MTTADFPPQLTLAPAAHAEGVVALPGSKSISNRTLLLAALARGTTTLTTGLLESDDTRVMLDALRALGIAWRDAGGHRYEVPGAGGAFPGKRADLHLGLSGLSMRTLVAALALSGGHYRADGVPRMRERPIADLVDALRPLGVDVRYESERRDSLPVLIGPGALRAAPVRIRGDVSSQFLTGLLQALPLLREGRSRSWWRANSSRGLMSRSRATSCAASASKFRALGDTFVVPAGEGYASPGSASGGGSDASGASYFIAAGLLGGGPVRVTGVGRDSIQGDVGFADVLARQGADVRMGSDWIEARRGGHVPRRHHRLPRHSRRRDDARDHRPHCRRAHHADRYRSWRVKETDRLAAMAPRNCARSARHLEEGPDWLTVAPPARLLPATIATYDDHRMAMCFALVAFGGVPVTIDDPGCVRKTFPGYFGALARIVG